MGGVHIIDAKGNLLVQSWSEDELHGLATLPDPFSWRTTTVKQYIMRSAGRRMDAGLLWHQAHLQHAPQGAVCCTSLTAPYDTARLCANTSLTKDHY